MITIAVLMLATAGALAAAGASRNGSRRIQTGWTGIDAPRSVGRVASWLDAGLARADVGIAGHLVLRMWVASIVAGGALGVVGGGVALGVLAVIGAVGAVPTALHLARDRAGRRLERDLPDALDALGRSLRSGASLRQAITELAGSATGQLGADLRRVERALDAGIGLAEALDGWRHQRALAGVRLAATALALGADTGGASARAVDGLAQTLRTNLAIEAEVRALSSQARLSALVIACAPVGFTALASLADPRIAHFLLRTPAGLLCLVAGLGLDAVGALWMRRLSVVRA